MQLINKLLARHLTAYQYFLKALGDVTEFLTVDFKPTAKLIDIISPIEA